MSKISVINIKDYIGVHELGLNPGKINIISGPIGSGKTTVIEAIEKIFTNQNRRTEVVRHGSNEATLYAELDNGLEVERKIRTEKADYLKIRKDGQGVPCTEKYLRSFIRGEIFKPLDWISKSVQEQTKSILSMLEIGWSKEDIERWFGELPSNVDYSQHILQILKSIELQYYKDREEVNREIKELKTQIEVIKKDLPADYDGEKWRSLKIQEYYNKVSEAQKINQYIEQAKSLQEGFETKAQAIKADAESDKSRVQLNYKDKRQDIKDIISLSKQKIEKAKEYIDNTGTEAINAKREFNLQKQEEIRQIEEKYSKLEAAKVREISERAEEQKDLIHIQENKIVQKTEELNSLDSFEKQELKAVDEKAENEIEKEKIRVGKAGEYLENHTAIDIEPLQKAADEVANMQTYLRDWDRMIDIRDGKLAEKERYSALLTSRIDTARKMPQELLKTAKMPIQGISVDEKGLIRINNTLIDGLSDGEKLKLAMTIAKAQCGKLKVICLDKFEGLNPKTQMELLESIKDDEFQYFITTTQSDKLQIEIDGIVEAIDTKEAVQVG